MTEETEMVYSASLDDKIVFPDIEPVAGRDVNGWFEKLQYLPSPFLPEKSISYDLRAQRPPDAMLRASQPTLRLLTLNLGLLGFNFFGLGRFALAAHFRERLAGAPVLIREAAADVVVLQEIFSQRDQIFLAEALADIYPHHTPQLTQGALLGSGLMILSRYPLNRVKFVHFSGIYWAASLIASRGFLFAAIDLPDIGTTSFVNVHLTSDVKANGQTAYVGNRRLAEVGQLLRFASGLAKPSVLIGDFNSSPRIAAQIYQRIVGDGYLDAFAAGRPHASLEDFATWDPANPLNIMSRYRHSPRQRIDHIFLSRDFAEGIAIVGSQIVLDQHCVKTCDGTVVPISDHAAVAVDLAATAAVNLRRQKPLSAHPAGSRETAHV